MSSSGAVNPTATDLFTAATARRWFAAAAADLEATKAELTALDAAIGDADHGINIARGFAAVAQKTGARSADAAGAEPAGVGAGGVGDGDMGSGAGVTPGGVGAVAVTEIGTDLGALFKVAGMTLMSAVGGASGMLYGNFFLRAAAAANGKTTLTAPELLAALQAGLEGIMARGRATVGDKTMVDAWTPALDALARAIASGASLPYALHGCVAFAEAGAESTVPLVAKKGRASYLGARSAGHLDPGAASTTIILRALCRAVDPEQKGSREESL
jgi:dihydroxyacetone kinase-like protein